MAENPIEAARRVLAQGENFLAYDLAAEAPGGVAKLHVQALALARSGALASARRLASSLPPPRGDPETAGLESRLYKDLAAAAREPAERERLFLKAAETSLAAFRANGSWYNGINAASCLAMAGRRDDAAKLAGGEVLPKCLAESDRSDPWLAATIGECRLLLGETAAAKECYRRAVENLLAAASYGSLSSVLRQLHMLSGAAPGAAEEVLQSLALPAVGAFHGEGDAAAARRTVRENSIRIAFSQCRTAAEKAFADEVLSAGGEVFIPGGGRAGEKTHPLETFCESTGEGDDAVRLFERRYIAGLARLKSKELFLPLSLQQHDKAPVAPEGPRYIKCLVFADVKGYSSLSERETVAFCRAFHTGVEREVLSHFKTDLQNTWGDAIHVVISDPAEAGRLALALRDFVAGRDWRKDGLSRPVQIRIALHAGVVTKIPDPITGRWNYIGRDTSRAARIEPIACENQVFTTSAFAALLASSGEASLSCSYAGRRTLPKNAGSIGVYLLNGERENREIVK